MDNGILQVTLSKPDGNVTGIKYNSIDNVLEVDDKETHRGYIVSLSFSNFDLLVYSKLDVYSD